MKHVPTLLAITRQLRSTVRLFGERLFGNCYGLTPTFPCSRWQIFRRKPPGADRAGLSNCPATCMPACEEATSMQQAADRCRTLQPALKSSGWRSWICGHGLLRCSKVVSPSSEAEEESAVGGDVQQKDGPGSGFGDCLELQGRSSTAKFGRVAS